MQYWTWWVFERNSVYISLVPLCWCIVHHCHWEAPIFVQRIFLMHTAATLYWKLWLRHMRNDDHHGFPCSCHDPHGCHGLGRWSHQCCSQQLLFFLLFHLCLQWLLRQSACQLCTKCWRNSMSRSAQEWHKPNSFLWLDKNTASATVNPTGLVSSHTHAISVQRR